MNALIWIMVIVAVYFFLKQFDSKKENEDIVSDASQFEPKLNPNAEVQVLKFFCIKDKGYYVSVWPNVDGYVDLDYVEFKIAGITHHREAAMNHLVETLGILVAEPDNPYDANAIRIMTPDWQCVGYIPKDRTEDIRKHTNLPCPCIFYIDVREENGEQIFYTDAYIRLDMLNDKETK